MKIKYLIILSLIVLVNNINAQEVPTFCKPQQQLTSSPTAGTLGTYGGLDEKKSSGGIAKNIPLFQLKQGAISYNPNIEYFSTGIRVNEWGGRLGIGWTDNFTAIIQRTVRSVPDEYTTQRLTTPGYQLVQTATSENYHIISTLEADGNAINGVGSFDGEYDLFSYNIFGVSGQFIIVNNQVVLLSHKENVKIDILSTSPFHKFCVTDTKGFKYYFETEIEYTCMGEDAYVTTSLPTAWFLNKIESPYKDVLNFNYISTSYACKTDFSQYFTYKNGRELDDDEVVHPEEEYFYQYYGSSYNVSRRYTQTKCLASVIGTNFKLTFDYVSREDLVGDKLLAMITLYDGQNNIVSNVDFDYDTYIATTQPQGALFVDDDLYSWNYGDIKKRYFLKNVTFLNTGSKAKIYGFGYINPQNLPHRFSFSQDECGYYNGQLNTWFIPRARVEKYIAQHPTLWTFPFTFTGNREPNYTASKAGILHQITYPTGGSDEIEYSPNTYIDWENEESYFPGLRVSMVTTSSLTSPPIIKSYNYTTLTKTDNKIIFNDLPSSNTIDRGNPFVRRLMTRTQYELSCMDIYIHIFTSNSRFNLNGFNGSPIAYSCVTERTEESFIASIFNVSSDQLGWVLYGDESFLNPLENTSWDNGLEILRYYGTKDGYLNYILKEEAWNYENTLSLAAENCKVLKNYEKPGGGTCTGYVTWEPYTIISYNLWNNWYKLRSFTETQYNEGQNLLIKTTNYYYDNTTHGLLTREETTDSKGNFIKKTIKYPSDINTGT